MAFPSIAEAISTATASSTSHALNLPASIAADDLLIAIFWQNGSGTDTFSWGDGFTELYDGNLLPRTAVAWKKAAGTEGGGTVTVSAVSTNAIGLGVVLKIPAAQWDTASAPDIGTVSTGTGTAPDSPGVTATGGSADNLFLTICIQDADSSPGGDGFSAIPTNYAHVNDGTESSPFVVTDFGIIGVFERELAAASDDPGTATLNNSQQYQTFSLVVPPSATSGQTVTPSGIASAEAFGTPAITGGVQTLSPSGIASAEAFGSPTLTVIIKIALADPFHNGSMVLASESSLTAYVLNASTRALVATVTGLATDGSGILDDITDGALVASTSYKVIVAGFSGGEEAYVRSAST